MARPSHPAPPPIQVDTVRVVIGGAVVWAVALVVLLLLGDRVDPVWRWTCVAGIALAGCGLALMRWQGRLGSGDPDRLEPGERRGGRRGGEQPSAGG